MSTVADTVRAPDMAEDPGYPPTSSGARGSRRWAPAAVAAGAFALFCVVVLTKATRLLEPDDSAYLASIIALAHGHLSLTTAQYHALSSQMRSQYGTTIMQWHQLGDGRWISEKNPGYPFYAVAFYWLGILRAAPLFAAGLASTSLFAAGRRWLGRWGGTWTVILFLFSGMALSFAWRPTMPSFTDAALVAAGAGALVWTFLADDAPLRRRTVVGLAGFLALEAAVAMRYTDVAMAIVAAVAVLALHRWARIPVRALVWWFGSAVVAGGALLAFNTILYGGPFKTGYSSGVITFSTGAIIPNLETMPAYLVRALPALLLGLAALGWMAVRLIRGTGARRDAGVGLVLATGWLGLWVVYSAYTWTVQGGHQGGAAGPGGGGGVAIHLIRFYLPAIGLVALLGAWFLVQLPRWVPPVLLAVVAGLGLWSFEALTAVGAIGGPRGGFPSGFPRGRGIPGGFPGGGPPSGPPPAPKS